MNKPDVIIVGAGLTGATIARILHQNIEHIKIRVIEHKHHLGGLCFDEVDTFDDTKILVHKFGPHIFHTKDKVIWKFVNKIVGFRSYEYYVTARVHGNNIPLPFNLKTIETLFGGTYGKKISLILVKLFGFGSIIKLTDLNKGFEIKGITAEENVLLKNVYPFLYKTLIEGYNKKQWGNAYDSYGLQTVERLPFRINYDCRYFDDTYCGIPSTSYSEMIGELFCRDRIEYCSDPKFVKFIHNQIYIDGEKFKGIVVYTGRIDYLLKQNHLIQPKIILPGITTKFIMTTKNVESFQDTAQVNYPLNFDYTRIIEHKKITGRISPKTIISHEYPEQINSSDSDLMYPIRTNENIAKYNNMVDILSNYKNLYLCGRQATYSYINMDTTIKQAMETADKILERIS
jgi:UDP-galactopyranose mutase